MLIVLKKPGNSGGGKEPQLEANARSDEDGGIGDEPNNPGKCSEVTACAKALPGASGSLALERMQKKIAAAATGGILSPPGKQNGCPG